MNRKQVGEYVLKRRKMIKMTQVELSKSSGFSQGKLSKVERGKLDLSVSEFFLVAKSLGAKLIILEMEK